MGVQAPLVENAGTLLYAFWGRAGQTAPPYATNGFAWTNGFVERMNRTLLDECFRVAGRTTWYVETEEIQRDLDADQSQLVWAVDSYILVFAALLFTW